MTTPIPSRHRQGALWPWLVSPLVTLALFFVLRHEREVPAPAPEPPPAAADLIPEQ
jgi:hypothetical protein